VLVDQVDEKGFVKLLPSGTPKRLVSYVFANPLTRKPWEEIRKMFRRACQNAKLEGI